MYHMFQHCETSDVVCMMMVRAIHFAIVFDPFVSETKPDKARIQCPEPYYGSGIRN